jgi:hypothetical protein
MMSASHFTPPMSSFEDNQEFPDPLYEDPGWNCGFDSEEKQFTQPEEALPITTVQQTLPLKKHRRPKGTGPDSKPHRDDDYEFKSGFHYNAIKALTLKPMPSTFIREIVKQVEILIGPDEEPNRCAKRRLPVAYKWLDNRQHRISRELLHQAISKTILILQGKQH